MRGHGDRSFAPRGENRGYQQRGGRGGRGGRGSYDNRIDRYEERFEQPPASHSFDEEKVAALAQ